jgi:hypothetical protein
MKFKPVLIVLALMMTSCYYLTVHEQPYCRGIGNGISEDIFITVGRIDGKEDSISLSPRVSVAFRGCENFEETRIVNNFGQRTYTRAFFEDAERKGRSNFWVETKSGLKLVPDKHVRQWKKYADRYSDSTSSALP